MPCDVREPGQLESVFDHIRSRWGKLDFLLHSIAYAPKEDLHRRITDCSQAGFAMAMDVSCHSFIRMASLAEPLMTDGGCLLTVTFYGSEKAVEDYNLMGPVKAALESSVRYLAAELAPRHIRVHALSPGPLKTRAASGIERFDELLERTRERTPGHRLVDIEDVGNVAAISSTSTAAITWWGENNPPEAWTRVRQSEAAHRRQKHRSFPARPGHRQGFSLPFPSRYYLNRWRKPGRARSKNAPAVSAVSAVALWRSRDVRAYPSH
jgi:enoyl-[acyl-carrier protein] reductase I